MALYRVGTAEYRGICTEHARHEHGASGGGNTVHPADQWFCAAEARDGGGWNTVSTDTRGDTTGIHGSMTAVAATARQHHGANTDIPAGLLPQTTADSPDSHSI